MEISWLGHACFQLRGKNVVLITDPFTPQPDTSPEEASRLGKLHASIVTVSQNQPAHNNVEDIQGQPRVVRGPGEYEINEVLITGVSSQKNEQQERNTIYVIHIDELVVCHLGNPGQTLQEAQLEEVADADVLFVPIGGGQALNATQAAEVISQIEPRIVIPMLYPYSATETTPTLATFCREMGVEMIQPQPKYNVTRNSLPAERQVILLSPRT